MLLSGIKLKIAHKLYIKLKSNSNNNYVNNAPPTFTKLTVHTHKSDTLVYNIRIRIKHTRLPEDTTKTSNAETGLATAEPKEIIGDTL